MSNETLTALAAKQDTMSWSCATLLYSPARCRRDLSHYWGAILVGAPVRTSGSE